MEEEKKNKKNKKKKNKQTKTPDNSVPLGVGESTSVGHSHALENGQNNFTHLSEAAQVQNDEVAKTDVDLNIHHANGIEGASILAEVEKLHWMDREASLEEKIRALQKEKVSQIQKEATLEEKIKQVQEENDARIQKEASLDEKIKQIQQENVAIMKKEASLEGKLKQLELEKDAHMQKEACLEMKILKLQCEKDYLLQKEAGFEEKINQLGHEAATLSLNGVSLEEKIKQMEREIYSWVQKENSANETVASLDGDNTKLRAEVRELEESRNILLQENQLLTKKIAGLQSKIQSLERNTTPESTVVKCLYVESDQKGVTTELSSSVVSDSIVLTEPSACVTECSAPGSDPVVATAEWHETACAADPVYEASERVLVSGENMESMVVVDVLVKDERNGGDYMNAKDNTVLPNSSENKEEIVQIPLEVEDLDLQGAYNDEKADVVLLSDAPLVGAPFRLISFVARFISGADLVNKSSVNSGR